jgi:hypothetical protein
LNSGNIKPEYEWILKKISAGPLSESEIFELPDLENRKA